MAETTPEEEVLSLYHAALDDAWVDTLVDSKTVDFGKLMNVLRVGFYDAIVNQEMVIDELVMNSRRPENDGKEGLRKMTQVEVDKLIDDMHGKLKRIPISYEILIPIPRGYPLKEENLTDSISVVRLSEKEVAEYDAANPKDENNNYLIDVRDTSKTPIAGEKYLLIKDSGFIKSAKNMSLYARHDPVRIFRLFMISHMIYGNFEMYGIMAILGGFQRYSAKAYDGKVFVGSINSLNNTDADISRARFPLGQSKGVEQANSFFKLILEEKTGSLEKVRVQIANSLYWFFEHLNTDDLNLQIVYLVSAFDSLFSIKHSNVPNVENIAPVIAEAISDDFSKRDKVFMDIKELYSLRNSIIHGGLEIQNLRKADQSGRSSRSATVSRSMKYYQEYMKKMFKRYVSSNS